MIGHDIVDGNGAQIFDIDTVKFVITYLLIDIIFNL